MPFDGSGTYTTPATDFPPITRQVISSAKYTNVINDVATALNKMICRDGQSTVTANIPMSGFKLTGVGAGVAPTDAATMANLTAGDGVYITAVTGTGDAILLTPSPSITAYSAGQTFRFIAAFANTGATTVAISGLAAKAVTKNGATALIANDILAGMMVQITYDGTEFILGTHLTADVATLTGTQTLTNKTITSPVMSGTMTGTYTVGGTPTFADNIFRVSGSADATKKAAFEVDGITTGTTRTLTVQDEDGTVALTSEFDYANLAGSSGRVPFPAMWMQGLTFSNNAGDAVNDIDIAAGQCRDNTNAHNLIVSALTKRLDASWAVGTAQGGLDTGSIGNSDYYIWAIKRSDTGVCDVLFSLSSTAPTMPANYDFKRLIGWFKRVGATIVTFTTYETDGGGLELLWSVPTLDVSLTNTLTTARHTDAVKVPLNFSTTALLNVAWEDDGSASIWVCCPDQTDAAPSESAAPLSNFRNQVLNTVLSGQISIRTSSAGLIASRSNTASIDAFYVVTLGFRWARRN